MVSNYLIALSTGVLSKAGGTFTLTANANFGATYGLVSKYFTSGTASPASAGILRLANADYINWRNAANDGEVGLSVNASNQLVYTRGATVVPFLSSTGALLAASSPALTGDVTSPGATGVTTVAAIQGTAVSGVTGTGAVVFSASPTLTGNITLGDTVGIGSAPISGEAVLIASALSGPTGQIMLDIDGSYSGATASVTGILIEHFLDGSSFTATNAYGIHVNNILLSGSSHVTHQYGLYVDSLTSGGTDNYAIYTAGTTPSQFGGAVGITGVATFTAQPVLSSLTISQAVFTDGSKGLVSKAVTGTGSVVMSASPTFTGTPVFTGSSSGTTGLKASAVASGTITLPAATDTLVGKATTDSFTNKTVATDGTNVIGSTAISGATGSGSLVFSDSPVLSGNISGDNFVQGYTTTATGASTTTLSVTSKGVRYFTGSTTETCKLPVVSTLTLGTSYTIVNLSSGVVTVQSSGANTLQAMAANTQLVCTSIATSGTGTASWNWQYSPVQNTLGGTGSVTSVACTVPGGFTISGSPITTSGTLAISASGTSGGIPYYSGASTMASSGALTAHGVVVGGGAGTTPAATVAGGTTTVLAGAGASADPTFQDLRGNSTLLKAPTVQTFTSQLNTYTVTALTVQTVVGATYTDAANNTYTIQATANIGATTVLATSTVRVAAQSASGNLSKASGTGQTTIAFSSVATGWTYTAATSPSPLYLKVYVIGGGGGGAGSSTVAAANGGAGGVGTASFFSTSSFAQAGGGTNATQFGGGAGGTNAISGPTTVFNSPGNAGMTVCLSPSNGNTTGGSGGAGFFGGAPTSTNGGSQPAQAGGNTGAGGAGAGYGASANYGGSGGGAGGILQVIVASPSATYPISVGMGGNAGAAGTGAGAAAGGYGAPGQVIIEEHYQ